MPKEIRPKALWILNKLSADLQQARMWPVKLAHLKHQESLCNLVLRYIVFNHALFLDDHGTR